LRSPGMMSRYDVGHSVVHLHGAHVPWTSDGYSMRVSRGMGNPTNRKTVLRSGEREIFKYPNTQHGGATLWYHDHTMDSTSMNVYAGLAGAYLLRHRRELQLVSLPKGNYEIPLIIQDRSFTDNGELLYGDAKFLNQYRGNDLPTGVSKDDFRAGFFDGTGTQPSPEFKGQVICVNGKIWPFLEVEPRPYRFRIVNGSNSRMYVIRLSNSQDDLNLEPDLDITRLATDSILQIGADGGLLPRSVPLTGNTVDGVNVDTEHFLVLASGERADIIIDFSDFSGKSIFLTNHAIETAVEGDVGKLGNGGDTPDPKTTDAIIKFVVNQPLNRNVRSALKSDLSKLDSDLAMVSRSLAIASRSTLPDLAAKLPSPLQPNREYLIKEFGPIPLTAEEANKPQIKGWNAITFQQNINDRQNSGLLWGGLPPYQDGAVPPVVGAVPNGGPQPDLINLPHLLDTGLDTRIEVWDFYNISVDVHPIHLHHSSVQLYSRVDIKDITDLKTVSSGSFNQGIDINEQGWKDTVRMNPQQRTRILVRFDDGGDKNNNYTGHYVWHCHILEHEDMGMMRPLEIEA
jgi:spore coat protein A, manganese oxidase